VENKKKRNYENKENNKREFSSKVEVSIKPLQINEKRGSLPNIEYENSKAICSIKQQKL